MPIEIRSETEINEKIKSYIQRLTNVQKQVAELKLDLKELDQEFKIEGVPVSKVKKVMAIIKKESKTTANDKLELDSIRDFIESDNEIVSCIQSVLEAETSK